MAKMSREQFEAVYARMSKSTVHELYDNGLRLRECWCGANNCPGWEMIDTDSVAVVSHARQFVTHDEPAYAMGR
jgi:hypothetical protein